MSPISINIYRAKIEPNLTEKQKVVLEVIRENPGLTCWEIAEALGRTASQISGRFGELKRQNLIYSGDKRRSVSRFSQEEAQTWFPIEEAGQLRLI